jgi:hypothetical protein
VQVEFVKLSEQSCLARAARPDGALVETTATAKGGIPHDLEHFIVEDALHCDTGLWARVCQGAEFPNFRVTRNSSRRRPQAWHRELAKGYSGWDEDLVTKVVDVYQEARGHGWSPPATLPRLPTMALLLDPRRRPPAEAVFSKETITSAVVALWEAEQQWRRLPVGDALTRHWDNRRPRGRKAGRVR